MKNTIYILLTALVLNLLNCYGAFGGTLNQLLDITTYWHYGGGATHLNLDAVKEFKQQRAFVDNTVVALDSMGRFKTEPTPHGNYKYDTDLTNRKALGHYNYWSTQGLMDWQEPGTYIDSKTGQVKDRSMRKTCIPYGKDPYNPETWKDLAELCKRVAGHYNGKGILDAIGFQNEYDFKWNVWRTMRQKEYAVLFKECYKAVRSVNPTIDIYTGGSIYPSPDSVLVLLNAIKAEFAKTGEPMPTDFFIDVHIYMRNTSNDQTGGTMGITPEAAKVYELGLKFDKIVKDWNLKGFVFGEGGWSPYSGKQSAPIMQGYDSFHAQAFATLRATFIMATIPTFKGYYFWHCNEKYDASPYNFGFNYKNWTATQARIVTQEFRNKYGNHEVANFRQQGELYAVDLIASADTTTLIWTDQNKFGNYDAKPREGNLQPTPTTTGLTVVNKRLHLNGVPFKINEANSPESRLRDLNYTELDQLANCGINTIYCTLFGGDVTTIHPFINRSNPVLFDEVKVNSWVSYFQYWLAKSPNNILHLLLSEKENHYELSEANHKAMISYFANKFRAFEGRIIYDREELDNGRATYINTYYSYLKQVAPLSVRAMHNNTNQNPWSGFENSDLIQLLSLQEWNGNFNNRIISLTNSGRWAAYASEVTGGIQTFPSCSTLVNTLASAGGQQSSGAGYYIASKDLSPPTFQSQYCGCYQYGASILGGAVTPPDTIIPTPSGIEIRYSTSYTRSPSTVLGTTLSQGSYWLFSNVAVNWELKKGTSVIKTATNTKYLNGNSNTYLQRGFTYTLTTTNASGTKVITFVVN